jgi:hypothetical protein
MFNPSRDQARQFFFEIWRKYREEEPLSGLETITLEVILQHPEYHAILQNMERYLDKDFPPEMGETNPFLHMSMHVAIKEQLAIDQPVGICQKFKQIQTKLGDEHEAMHHAMECLAEMLWQAQRDQSPPNAQIYLDCMEQKINKN